MNRNLEGWLKIYLFYGAIFFSLGLFGALLKNDLVVQRIQNDFQIIARQLRFVGEPDGTDAFSATLPSDRAVGIDNADNPETGEDLPVSGVQADNAVVYLCYPDPATQTVAALALTELTQNCRNQFQSSMETVLDFPYRDPAHFESTLARLVKDGSGRVIVVGIGLKTVKQEPRLFWRIILPEYYDSKIAQLVMWSENQAPKLSYCKRPYFRSWDLEFDWVSPAGKIDLKLQQAWLERLVHFVEEYQQQSVKRVLN